MKINRKGDIMTLDIMKSIENFFDAIGKFVKDNYNNPVFWGVLFLVILGIAVYVIKELADK